MCVCKCVYKFAKLAGFKTYQVYKLFTEASIHINPTEKLQEQTCMDNTDINKGHAELFHIHGSALEVDPDTTYMYI